MLYKNDSPVAAVVMERARTCDYGDILFNTDNDCRCPICGESYPSVLYWNTYLHEYVGCENCIKKEFAQ